MKYLYLDTETGGIKAATDALLTIGLVAHCDDRGILEEMEIAVQPEGLVIHPEALAVNHINMEEHLKIAVSRKKAALIIKQFIARNFGTGFPNIPFVVGHNIAFDRAFVDPLFADDKFPPYSYRNLDTMGIALFMHDLGILPSAKSLKLDFLIDRYSIEIASEKRHTALGDALATRLAHLAMREEVKNYYAAKHSN